VCGQAPVALLFKPGRCRRLLLRCKQPRPRTRLSGTVWLRSGVTQPPGASSATPKHRQGVFPPAEPRFAQCEHNRRQIPFSPFFTGSKSPVFSVLTVTIVSIRIYKTSVIRLYFSTIATSLRLSRPAISIISAVRSLLATRASKLSPSCSIPLFELMNVGNRRSCRLLRIEYSVT